MVDDIMNNLATFGCDHFKSAGFCLRSSFTDKVAYSSPLKLLAILIMTHPQQRHRARCMELGYVCLSSQSNPQMLAN